MVKIISDYGYCFGVETAIKKLYQAAKKNKKLYLNHPLIHNYEANKTILEETDSELISDETEVQDNSIVVFSAHGHKIEDETKYSAKAEIIDATCPLITKRYMELEKVIDTEASFIFLGKPNHQETIGFLSHFSKLLLLDVTKDLVEQIEQMKLLPKIYLIPQTTISEKKLIEAKEILLKKYEVISYEICPFYQKRYLQCIKFLENVDINKSFVIVAGDKSSSNANEIYRAIKQRFPSIQIMIALKISDLNLDQLQNKDIYITSATSASKLEVETLAKNIKDALLYI